MVFLWKVVFLYTAVQVEGSWVSVIFRPKRAKTWPIASFALLWWKQLFWSFFSQQSAYPKKVQFIEKVCQNSNCFQFWTKWKKMEKYQFSIRAIKKRLKSIKIVFYLSKASKRVNRKALKNSIYCQLYWNHRTSRKIDIFFCFCSIRP